MSFKYIGHLLLEIVKLKMSQKTKGAQVKRHNWWYRLLQEKKEHSLNNP